MVEKTRTDLLNFLIRKYKLKTYLEIGVQDPTQNFNKIDLAVKIGVDPDPNANCIFTGCIFTGTSDEFFKEWGPGVLDNGLDQRFGLIFIDGLHTADQVKKDFENALNILHPNGFIVIHDCNPKKEEHTIVPRPSPRGHWNGDVYKFAVMISNQRKVTVDIDNGCLVFTPGMVLYRADVDNITWEKFNTNRESLLNLISWNEFIDSHSHV